jgi:hypothetical protein
MTPLIPHETRVVAHRQLLHRAYSQGYESYYRFKSIMGVCYTLNFIIELVVGAWYAP